MRCTAFTIVEIIVVVAILAMLAALAVPGFIESRRKSLGIRIANDLRVHAQAFQMYFGDHGTWPDTSYAGFPEGMESYLPASWNDPTPGGGVYTWIYQQRPIDANSEASIRIPNRQAFPISADESLWRHVDKALDDDSLDTGNVRMDSQGRLVYFLKTRASG